MSGVLYANFLSPQEKQAITQNYIRLLELIKPEELMLILVQNRHMTPFEKSDFKSKTDNDKGQYIIDNVFLKSTYQQLVQIKRCLVQSRVSSHTEVARLLPSRPGETSEIETVSELQENSMEPPSKNILKGSETSDDIVHKAVYTTTDKENPVTFDSTSMPEADFSISQVSGIQTGNFDSGAPDIGSLSLHTEETSQPMSVVKSPSNPQLMSKLGCYDVKEGNPQGTGDGLVVVLANFTDHLYGYHKDTEDIKAFFKNEMKYTHIYAGKMNDTSLMNLCREEMLEVLQIIQGFLTNPLSGNRIDRFYLFLLSHGNEDGILTCEKGTSDAYELDDGEPISVSIQEIVDMFTHDKVPLLKGFPKVIFRQTCQGDEDLKAATLPIQPGVTPPHPSRPLAIGADVMICEATSLTHMSFVSDKSGSIFLQTALQAMQQHCTTDHLQDILVEVNRLVALLQKRVQDPTSKKFIKAIQMPGIISRLTAKLYLKGPPPVLS